MTRRTTLSGSACWILRIFSWMVLGLLYLLLALIVILSFNTATSLRWPPDAGSTGGAVRGRRPAGGAWTSVKLALAATAVAPLGTPVVRFHRYKFFGRSSLSFIVLPIAPRHRHRRGAAQTRLSGWVGTWGSPRWSSATARSASCWPSTTSSPAPSHVPERAGGLGRPFGESGWQTFRHVTFLLIRSPLAGGLWPRSSFDEIVVTTFTAGAGIETLPQWILNNFARPNNVPPDSGGDRGDAAVDPAGLAGPTPSRRAAGASDRPLTWGGAAMGAELIFLILIAVVLVFGFGVLLVSRSRVRGVTAAALPSAVLEERPFRRLHRTPGSSRSSPTRSSSRSRPVVCWSRSVRSTGPGRQGLRAALTGALSACAPDRASTGHGEDLEEVLAAGRRRGDRHRWPAGRPEGAGAGEGDHRSRRTARGASART